jgi:hypothetical protein
MEATFTFTSDEITAVMGGLNVMASYKEIVNALTRLELHMAALDDAIALITTDVASLTDVDARILKYVAGVPALIAAAVADAQAAGANATQLASMQALHTAVSSQVAALTAGTPLPTP